MVGREGRGGMTRCLTERPQARAAWAGTYVHAHANYAAAAGAHSAMRGKPSPWGAVMGNV